MEAIRKQTRKVGVAGNLINQLMGNNSTIPVVGEGATICLYSDRHAYEVVHVSKDCNTVMIQRYNAKNVSTAGYGSELYEYDELLEQGMTLVWRKGAWRQVIEMVEFTDEFYKTRNPEYKLIRDILTDEEMEAIYQGEVYPQNVVEGYTRLKQSFPKVSIVFGTLDERYDFSF